MSNNDRWRGVRDETKKNLYVIANARPTIDAGREKIEKLIEYTRQDIMANYNEQLKRGLLVELDVAVLCYDHKRTNIGLGF